MWSLLIMIIKYEYKVHFHISLVIDLSNIAQPTILLKFDTEYPKLLHISNIGIINYNTRPAGLSLWANHSRTDLQFKCMIANAILPLFNSSINKKLISHSHISYMFFCLFLLH